MLRLLSVLLVAVILLSGPLTSSTAEAVGTARFFAETEHNVKDAFLQFWTENGGLPIFGYPISSEFEEDGLRVQYFERAVFEYHPDLAGSPFEVQLRHLGTLLAGERSFTPIEPFESTDIAWYFPETGHSLAHGFLEYWRQNGGLRNFGYPISEELQEEGLTVQYFERARFEYHPEYDGSPYEVLLGLLGSQYAATNGIPDDARSPESPLGPDADLLGPDGLVKLGWWGTVTSPSMNARTGPSTSSPVAGVFTQGMTVKVLAEVPGEAVVPGNSVWYQIDGGRHKGSFLYSGFVQPIEQPAPSPNIKVPASVGPNEVWVDVDLSRKVLTLLEGNRPFFATYVAIGTPRNPTVVGEFRVWIKQKYDDMAGRPPVVERSYDLKNVPWVQYFYRGYALHGTYWHDNFTTHRSAGCVNLTIGDAEYVFSRTSPPVPPDKRDGLPSAASPGTVVVTHW